MKKVALIYSKNISDLTGVSAVMRSLQKIKTYLKKMVSNYLYIPVRIYVINPKF